ncbi:MAG: DUF116 domain-containing protein [Polyangiaceae bacterium]|nr:DUF116 domain-containing protein [Polyangiaceae bacterium]
MTFPTYSLRPDGAPIQDYLSAVSRLADEVLRTGEALGPILEAYGDFVEALGNAPRRTRSELLVEALLLGVLWRTRGHEATAADPVRSALVARLVSERRRGVRSHADGATAALLLPESSFRPGHLDPSLAQIAQLLDWLLASGEYDDELKRLEGLIWFLGASHASAEHVLAGIVHWAAEFEAMGERTLGVYTARVQRFLSSELERRGAREDTLQCSRRPAEYHWNMVGAEILNRAWRADFLDCSRHLVVLPSCARIRHETDCRALGQEHALKCSHCAVRCPVSQASRAVSRLGAEALAVVHGSDFGRLLRSPALADGGVGVLGVACVPGLVGAGWRVRAAGLPAQCVLLESSGCAHWLDQPVQTSFDLGEIERLLTPDPAGRGTLVSRIAQVA